MYQTSLTGNSNERCSPTWNHLAINKYSVILRWALCWVLLQHQCKAFFVWECFMNCTKEMVIAIHREYIFSIFSMNSRKSWGILTVAWLVLWVLQVHNCPLCISLPNKLRPLCYKTYLKCLKSWSWLLMEFGGVGFSLFVFFLLLLLLFGWGFP